MSSKTLEVRVTGYMPGVITCRMELREQKYPVTYQSLLGDGSPILVEHCVTHNCRVMGGRCGKSGGKTPGDYKVSLREAAEIVKGGNGYIILRVPQNKWKALELIDDFKRAGIVGIRESDIEFEPVRIKERLNPSAGNGELSKDIIAAGLSPDDIQDMIRAGKVR